MMAIGALSKSTGVNIETIRYYERVGVLPKARRAENGRRLYNADDAQRLTLIRRARELGFELSTVRALLVIQAQSKARCDKASRLATAQFTLIESRIKQLVVLREELARMIDACDNGRVAECRIIEVLGSESAPRD